jgi:hypothetical protein
MKLRKYRGFSKEINERYTDYRQSPPTDSGDSGTLPHYSAQGQAERRYVADVILRNIRRSTQPNFCYCTTHRVIVAMERDGRGTSYRDFANNTHGKPYDLRCQLVPIGNEDMYEYFDSESDGKLSELMSSIVRVKELVDAKERESNFQESNDEKRRREVHEIRMRTQGTTHIQIQE